MKDYIRLKTKVFSEKDGKRVVSWICFISQENLKKS